MVKVSASVAVISEYTQRPGGIQRNTLYIARVLPCTDRLLYNYVQLFRYRTKIKSGRYTLSIGEQRGSHKAPRLIPIQLWANNLFL